MLRCHNLTITMKLLFCSAVALLIFSNFFDEKLKKPLKVPPTKPKRRIADMGGQEFESKVPPTKPKRRIADMTGEEFELFLKDLFEKLGYRVTITPRSNDRGVDLILFKDRLKTVVQAKRWNKKVDGKAVQEILCGVKLYKADKGMVITNQLFTKGAYDIAKPLGIELWDGYKLIEVIIRANKDKQL